MRSLALLLALALAAPLAAQPVPGSLTVLVEGVRGHSGRVVVCLFRTSDGFPWEASRASDTHRIDAVARSVSLVLEEVPPGEVAVLAFHDRDDDGALDRDHEGRPTEAWAITGPAILRFDAAALVVEPGGVTLTRLLLRYP